ncbi:enoyl-CoA hydratase/isomerase family protein [Cytophagaceae bacterium DM2B3-1]|uniref:Enoyl-CoA hydratase/isomerase family protein n=1 Tax=Xanthocytophaga flava TaxID=3048013 RepID=A0ABT7CUJ9_9BACT|nr:enoyl-CoA hydratase/isomerase family protein [Xanthocytophaga flavus]MDJ1497443.1 enoyl-CoA hydratase/isomerase family protein [Xanthocytophaga flavus]
MIFTTQKINQGYWKVLIDNPPVNIFDAEFSNQLRVLLDQMEADENLKVVVFESANPDFFVAHVELIDIAAFPKGPGKTGLSIAWPDLAKRLEQAPFVSIASIRGRARGIGSEFIQAFDIRFASKEKAIFAQPEIGIGAFPGGGGLERLPLLIGRAKALEVIMSGDDYNAETAASYGWINRAIPDNELDTFVDNFAKRVSSFDKQAITSIKATINQRVTLPQNDHLQETQQRFFASLEWPESRQRVKSLLEKGLQKYSDVELNLAKYL